MEALCEELVPLIDGGELLHNGVHDGLFFHQAQPAAVGGRVEVGVGGQRVPRDGEGTVGILQSPDMPGETRHIYMFEITGLLCQYVLKWQNVWP